MNKRKRYFASAGEKRKFYNNVRHFAGTRQIGFACMGLLPVLLPFAALAFVAFTLFTLLHGASVASPHISGLKHAGMHGFSYVASSAGLVGVVTASNRREKDTERHKVFLQMKAIHSKAETENRAFTSDELTEWNKLALIVSSMKEEIQRFDEMQRLDAEFHMTNEPRFGNIHDANGDREATKDEIKAVARAFDRYCRFGMDNLSAEEKNIMATRFRQEPGGGKIRAAQTVTTSGGGFLIPQGFSDQLDIALKQWGGMLRAADIITTDSGNPLPWPSVNDTGNIGELLGINTGAALQDFVFASVTLNAYKYSSKIVLVPIELLQDSYFDLNTFLPQQLGVRIGRIVNLHLTTGTGAGAQPNGVVPASTSGKVGLTGQTLTVIYDDLIDLQHAVDPAYRLSPKAAYMMNDSSLKVVKKIKDTTGRPLWMPYEGAVLVPGSPNMDTLLGFPLIINQDVASMAANAKSILFGDFSKYKVRRVMDIMVLRLVERYADIGQVGFLCFARYDGNLIDAGTHPIQFYQNSAT
jgi:HK97 family phage major capsid protein